MIHYLFVKIPNLFFLPIAVCATMGCVAAAVKCRKKNNLFYWIIVLSICIMCFWRLAANTLMLSARYASILLYPAIIFAAWFCCQINDLLQSSIEKHKNNPLVFVKLQKSFPHFIVVLLVIACLIKTLHYSPYTDHTIKLCNVLRKEITGKDYLIYTHTDEERIAYYAGIDINKVWSMGNQKIESIHELLKKRLKFSKNFLEDIYVIFYLKKEDQEPDAQTLQLDPSIGKWEYIHREYTSRRKNKEIVLYHFSPAHPNIEIWEKDITEMSPANLYENGDFEQPLTGKELEERIEYYIKRHASVFYTTPGRFFPKSWWLGVPPQELDGKSPEIALTDINPIAGKYSLEINHSHPITRS